MLSQSSLNTFVAIKATICLCTATCLLMTMYFRQDNAFGMDFIALGEDYLAQVNYIITDVKNKLGTFQESDRASFLAILSNLYEFQAHHEKYFDSLVPLVNTADQLDIYFQGAENIFEDVRNTGNSLVELIREIENILDVNTQLRPQWFEN